MFFTIANKTIDQKLDPPLQAYFTLLFTGKTSHRQIPHILCSTPNGTHPATVYKHGVRDNSVVFNLSQSDLFVCSTHGGFPTKLRPDLQCFLEYLMNIAKLYNVLKGIFDLSS